MASFFLTSICLLSVGNDAVRTGSETSEDVPALVQRRLLNKKMHGVSVLDQADAARFLMQATFGPTRTDLADFGEHSIAEWMKKQMLVPPTIHRVMWRERINPRFNGSMTDMTGYHEVGVCEKGASWINYALRADDEGKLFKIEAGKLYIDGVWRSDISDMASNHGLPEPMECIDSVPDALKDDPRLQIMVINGRPCKAVGQRDEFCTNEIYREHKVCRKWCWDGGFPFPGDDCGGGWAKATSGTICELVEKVGGKVMISAKGDCKSDVTLVLNPALWLADSSQSVERAGGLVSATGRFDTLLEDEDNSASCSFDKDDVLNFQGKFYAHDVRMALVENTIENPTDSWRPYGGECVKRNWLNAEGCKVQKGDDRCNLVCGSPGEVASVPSNGNRGSIRIMSAMEHEAAGRIPEIFYRTTDAAPMSESWGNSKTDIWASIAFSAKDQLRQRMAWSLSQIFVVSSNLAGHTRAIQEVWLNFYDIFVRRAFGNFRDLLREVSHTTAMGSYLTFKNSAAFDASKTFPDENYAREIMQLFTIGLDLLQEDGQPVLGDDGKPIPAYGDDNIMYFAGVWTGFKGTKRRYNAEASYSNGGHLLDLMFMKGEMHDRNPKPDLYGGYLGDGYPLCGELPHMSFLKAGARYDFIHFVASEGSSLSQHSSSGSPRRRASDMDKTEISPVEREDVQEVVVLSPDSDLYKALSTPAATIVLPQTVACKGKECSFGTVTNVQVGDALYEYVPPACVHSYIYNGVTIHHTKGRMNQKRCADPNTPVAAAACCGGCRQTWAKSCAKEKILKLKCGTEGWINQHYCRIECWKIGLGFPGDDCSAGELKEEVFCGEYSDRVTHSAASQRCSDMGLNFCDAETECVVDGMPVDEMPLWTDDECSINIHVFQYGEISAHTENPRENAFRVEWADGHIPPAGEYTASVKEDAAFSEIPSASEVDKLKIGSYDPGYSCSLGCDGAVHAYTQTGKIDAGTIFAFGGKFFKNVVSTVVVEGDYSFRNPPAFLSHMHEEPRSVNRAALAEVESMIDHLVHHQNTAPFFCTKLIQRLVSSNPSTSYVKDVADAFRNGIHQSASGEVIGTGNYGDLSAVLFAIFSHPEARDQSEITNGLLREPMLKLIHLLRAMEYESLQGMLTLSDGLDDDVGQGPHVAPTVFNFFQADFQPDNFAAQPWWNIEKPEELVAPEFEVFTAPWELRLVNGMSEIIKHGISNCDSGLGGNSGGGEGVQKCVGGSFKIEDVGKEGVVEMLDLLLTGSRLTDRHRFLVSKAYDEASGDSKLKDAIQAVTYMPAFHNLGNSAILSGVQHERVTPEPPPHPKAEYKAMIVIWMGGGMDGYHMVVPINCPLYDEYRERRQTLAHEASNLIPIRTSRQKCKEFGIHPAMSNIANLYKSNDAAFVANVGSLVEPVNRTGILELGKRRPVHLFSHSHQEDGVQTMKSQVGGKGPRGYGGRMVDELNKRYKSTSFAMNKLSTFLSGFEVPVNILHDKLGVITLDSFDKWESFVHNITQEKHLSVYMDKYVEAFGADLKTSESFSHYFENTPLKTDYGEDNSLERQLKQVAKVISTREAREAERDVFLVRIGGFDNHHDLIEAMDENLKVIDQAVGEFAAEMKAQGIFDNLVMLGQSEFGRTLSSNGAGTDHGWGSNHFVVGGGLQAEIYNDFIPSYNEGSELELKRGRLIPAYPWESIMVPIAKWMGVESMEEVFHNLNNFDASTHIIDESQLFR